MNEASVGAFAVTAVLGYAVVFIGLILLMIVIFVMGRVLRSRSAARSAGPVSAAEPAPVPAVSAALPAPGTAGELKLYNTDARTAAMLMAIVADELETPLNELRFKSIREVTSDEV